MIKLDLDVMHNEYQVISNDFYMGAIIQTLSKLEIHNHIKFVIVKKQSTESD
jgi:hypothetical protein